MKRQADAPASTPLQRLGSARFSTSAGKQATTRILATTAAAKKRRAVRVNRRAGLLRARWHFPNSGQSPFLSFTSVRVIHRGNRIEREKKPGISPSRKKRTAKRPWRRNRGPPRRQAGATLYAPRNKTRRVYYDEKQESRRRREIERDGMLSCALTKRG